MSRGRWLAAAAGVAVALALVLWLLGRGGDDEGEPQQPPPAAEAPATQPDEPRRPRSEGESESRERLRCDGSARSLEVAVQDDATLLHRHYYDRDAALRQIRALGATWLRTSVLWSRVVPDPRAGTPPAAVTYDWSSYDELVTAAERRGLCVEMSLSGPAPAWATADRREGVTRPDSTRFGEFAEAAVRHFRGRVSRYTIWNEPNFVSWVRPRSESPAIYRRLYQAGYAAVKRADPEARVLIGETAGFGQPGRATAPLAWLRAMACVDAAYRPQGGCEPLVADGYAHHPYDFEHDPEYRYPGSDNVTIGTLDRLTSALERLARSDALATAGGAPLPVYLTEFGYFATSRRAIPESRRAAYLPRAFEIARRHPRVRQMLQYLLTQPPADYPGGNFNTGLVTLDGQPGAAYQALRQWARDARRRAEIAEPLRR